MNHGRDESGIQARKGTIHIHMYMSGSPTSEVHLQSTYEPQKGIQYMYIEHSGMYSQNMQQNNTTLLSRTATCTHTLTN